MQQTRITKKSKLLNDSGELNQKGYATSLLLEYNRKDVKAHPLRIKEWDYYFVGNSQIGLAFVIADNSYMSLVGADLFFFEQGKKHLFKSVKLFPKGKLKMPTTSAVGDIVYKDRKVEMQFILNGDIREIYFKIPKFHKGKSLEFKGTMTPLYQDSLVIVTPYADDKKAFYYNQKVNNLNTNGTLTFGEEVFEFKNEQGVLDWGRGVWTRDNTWYWSSMSMLLEDGTPFGFNLGYGFGDTSAASENMAFYKGQHYKLNDVDFGIPDDSFMSNWQFMSKDGAINMTFTPLYDNFNKINLLFLRQNSHQVFGFFNGEIKLSKDQTVTIKNGFGFAEKVNNVW